MTLLELITTLVYAAGVVLWGYWPRITRYLTNRAARSRLPPRW